MEEDLQKKRFLWGLVLAWTPWIPTIIGLGYTFRGIAGTKATGLAAVAGGLSEVFVLCGILAILVGQVVAIILLFRALSSGHWMRSLFSVLSICMSGLMLLFVGFFFWLLWFQARHVG